MKCTGCQNEVLPVVALDIDGTLGGYHDHLLDFGDGYFGYRLRRGWDGEGNWEEYLGLSRRDYQEMKLAFRQGGMKRTMPVFSGARSLATTVREHGAELWITTTRPYNRLDSVDPDTREWLRRNHIAFDHLLYDDDKYHRLANIVGRERVALVVDDLPEQLAIAVELFGSGNVCMANREHNIRYRTEYSNYFNLKDIETKAKRNIAEWRKMYG